MNNWIQYNRRKKIKPLIQYFLIAAIQVTSVGQLFLGWLAELLAILGSLFSCLVNTKSMHSRTGKWVAKKWWMMRGSVSKFKTVKWHQLRSFWASHIVTKSVANFTSEQIMWQFPAGCMVGQARWSHSKIT